MECIPLAFLCYEEACYQFLVAQQHTELPYRNVLQSIYKFVIVAINGIDFKLWSEIVVSGVVQPLCCRMLQQWRSLLQNVATVVYTASLLQNVATVIRRCSLIVVRAAACRFCTFSCCILGVARILQQKLSYSGMSCALLTKDERVSIWVDPHSANIFATKNNPAHCTVA